MKLLWIKWLGGIESRDDGFTIYHNIGFVMLRLTDGRLEKFHTAEDAKREVERLDKSLEK